MTSAHPQDNDPSRRGFLGATALAAAFAGLASGARAATPVPTAFDAVEQIDAGVLNIGYVEMGPKDGPAVLLLHGWPYDIHAFVEVAP
uniref:twin-arginine translocation signal domain-containing protein n=1 Tax=Caulobacter sp. UNC358MFTsu5.1 TaxID=1449049 RepID=UPI0004A780B1